MNKTGYFSHPDCRRHDMGRGHPECPARLDAIEDRLLASGVADALDRREAPLASTDQIELAHDRMHVASLRGLAEEVREQEDAGGTDLLPIDPDTAMNRHTWNAVLRAAGAALAATDAVIAGELENAFCSVRPPGHHACRARPMGFCLFNNVAVGAAHALEAHGLERVAILDFDVHHGNGTEDIFRDDPRVMMVSTFQHPFYPHSGVDGRSARMVNVPLAAHSGREALRAAVEQQWAPALEGFRPQALLVSAGFDAHADDGMAGLDWRDGDYAWLGAWIAAAAARHCGGRAVSVLEGGYDLPALEHSVGAYLEGWESGAGA